jgi:soluble lytic murein transglycosylase
MVKKFTLILLIILPICGLIAGLNTRYPVRYTEIIYKNAGDLEPSLIFSVIKTESGFRHLAQSHKNAMGLMQVTEPTAAWMAEHMGLDNFEANDIWEPEINIAIGSYFLNWLVNYYQGDLALALCAYNAGMGNVNRWLADPNYSHDGKTLRSIPFPETDQYLQRVLFNQRVYDILLLFHKKP